MPDKVEPRFNPDSIRESVRSPMPDNNDHLVTNGVSKNQPKGSGILLNLVLLILVMASGGMGWLLLEQRQQLETTQEQLERLESLVQSRSEGNVAIESTLMDQVDQLRTAQNDILQTLEGELTQLMEAIAKETKDREMLQQWMQTLEQGITAQDARLQSLQDRPEPVDLSSSLEKLTMSINQVQIDLLQLQAKPSNDGQGEALQRLMTDFGALNARQQQQDQNLNQITENITIQRNQLQTTVRQLTTHLDRLQADLTKSIAATPLPSSSAVRTSDLAIIELSLTELREDIRAINNARLLINRDLLQIKEQLNRVQLRVE